MVKYTLEDVNTIYNTTIDLWKAVSAFKDLLVFAQLLLSLESQDKVSLSTAQKDALFALYTIKKNALVALCAQLP